MTQSELAAAAGISEATIRVLETSRRTSYQPGTLHDVARALHWTPDSIDRILSGLDPIPVDQATDSEADRLAVLEAKLPRLEAELREVKAALRDEMAQVKELLGHRTARSAIPLDVDPTDTNPDTLTANEDDPDEMQLWGYSKDQGGTREPGEIVQLVIEYRRRKYGLPPQHGASDTA